jgi:alkylation response protein AidB-like acyl-CoA dehydrogenase
VTLDQLVAECREFLDRNASRRPGHGGGAPPLGRAALFKSRAEEEATIPAARRYRAAKFDAGFGWISGPTRYGGRGLDAAYEACFDEIEAEYDVPNEDCFAPGLEYVGPIVLEFGGDELRDAVLPRLYRGDAIACQLFSEPDAGSDLASLRTEARRDGSVWRVNGQKIWTSRAHFSDVGLLLARTGAVESRHRGISAFVVDMRAPGVTVRPLRQMTGDAPFNEVFLDEVTVPDAHRLGDVDGGWRVAMSTLGRERAALARRHRHRPDGLVEIAAPTRVAEVLRGCGLANDPCRRQQWARVYAGQTVMHLTNERLAAAPAGAVADAARAMGKLMLARNLSYAAEVIASALGSRVAADTGEAWAGRWLPFVLGVPALHIGGGTDEMVLNSIGERVLGLPRDRT